MQKKKSGAINSNLQKKEKEKSDTRTGFNVFNNTIRSRQVRSASPNYAFAANDAVAEQHRNSPRRRRRQE